MHVCSCMPACAACTRVWMNVCARAYACMFRHPGMEVRGKLQVWVLTLFEAGSLLLQASPTGSFQGFSCLCLPPRCRCAGITGGHYPGFARRWRSKIRSCTECLCRVPAPSACAECLRQALSLVDSAAALLPVSVLSTVPAHILQGLGTFLCDCDALYYTFLF